MSPNLTSTLATLLQVAKEKPQEREKLLSILVLEPTRRKMTVNVLVTTMRQKNAPADFIEAWDALQDDALAEQIKRILQEPSPTQVSTDFTGVLLAVALLAGAAVFLFLLLV